MSVSKEKATNVMNEIVEQMTNKGHKVRMSCRDYGDIICDTKNVFVINDLRSIINERKDVIIFEIEPRNKPCARLFFDFGDESGIHPIK